MTNPNTTLIAALLDRSGSMSTSVEATEDGWRELINGERQNPGLCYVTWRSSIPNTRWSIRRPTSLRCRVQARPRGQTALLDAAGQFINEVGEQLSALPEHKRPGHVICLIATGGHENARAEPGPGRASRR